MNRAVEEQAREYFSGGLRRRRRIFNEFQRRCGRAIDAAFAARLRLKPAMHRLRKAAASQPRRRILVVGVQSDSRPASIDRVMARLKSRKHDIVCAKKGVEGKGKLQNINELVAAHDLSSFDWIWMIDDDVDTGPGFTDLFVHICERYGFSFAMPAHRFRSYKSFSLTKRRWNVIARTTRFVEVGPFTAFRRDTFADVFPLPLLRYGWGVDLSWSALASDRGWKMGVVDAAPMSHLMPISQSYERSLAVEEAVSHMLSNGFLPRSEAFQNVEFFRA